jgi:RHS repeat-associated protein
MVDILEITSPRPSPKERGKYPFGELDGGDEPTKHGFATAEYDGESSCFAMGMRMYSAEFGRFLSVDPLFEAMPRHTPYHYSFNSPLVWKDPSGLIPEKEKDRDRLMGTGLEALIYYCGVSEVQHKETGEELQRKSDEMSNFFIATKQQLEWMVNEKDLRSLGCGRTAGNGSGPNGILIEYKEQVVDNEGNTSWQNRHARYYQGQLYNEDGSDYSGNDQFVQKIYGWIMDLIATDDPEIINRIETMESSPRAHWIQEHTDPNIANNCRPEDTNHGSMPNVPVGSHTSLRKDALINSFAHEFLGHAFHHETATTDHIGNNMHPMGNHEVQAVNIENLVRFYFGMSRRTDYGGIEIPEIYLWKTHK